MTNTTNSSDTRQEATLVGAAVSLWEPKFNYTEQGIRRLSLVLQASIKYNNWSEREMARRAGISHGTANRYIKGRVYAPQNEIIKALAPHTHKVLRIDTKSHIIDIDPDTTYSDWTQLAKLATDEFIPEDESLNKFMSIVSKIKECMRRQNISQVEIENRLVEMQNNKTARMSLSRLREIQEQPTSITDDELRIIRNLVDPYENFFSEADWLRSAFPEIFLSQKSLAQPLEQGISENGLSKNGSH